MKKSSVGMTGYVIHLCRGVFWGMLMLVGKIMSVYENLHVSLKVVLGLVYICFAFATFIHSLVWFIGVIYQIKCAVDGSPIFLYAFVMAISVIVALVSIIYIGLTLCLPLILNTGGD